MSDATDLWGAVKASYVEDGLISLTNIRDRSQTAIDDDIGTDAAQAVLNVWEIYAQVAFDITNGTHVEVGKFGVIAMLYRRGGTSTEIEQVKWAEVFGPDGMVQMVKRTGPRARMSPASSSGTTTSREDANGPVYGWSDPASLPPTIPTRPKDVET